MLYPKGSKKTYQKEINYGSRGMHLESLIDSANLYYKNNDIAVIYKKPTPVSIKNINYTNNNKFETTGYLKSKSTLDYVGIYKGKYIDFDAKSTKSKTSFPLSNIHLHQINHIKDIIKHGGISFLIIEINNEVYLFDGNILIAFINDNQRKSIPYEYIKEKGYQITLKYNPVLDYIKIIDKYFIGGKYEKESK